MQYEAPLSAEGWLIREGTLITPSLVSLNLSDASMRGVTIQITDTKNKVIGDTLTYPVNASSMTQKKEGAISSVESFSFSPFSLPLTLLPGPYRMVCVVEGEEGALGTSQYDFYYLGKENFAVKSIRTYPPGTGSAYPMVPPEFPILINTSFSAGKELTPYIEWYGGTTKIAEGYIEGGQHAFFWQTPSKEGTVVLTARIYPEHPLKMGLTNPPYLTQKMSVFVSKKATKPGLQDRDYPYEVLSRFEGNLEDAVTKKPLWRSSSGQAEPRWEGRGNSYGMVIGSQDRYVLDTTSYLKKQETVSHRYQWRFSPYSKDVEGIWATIQEGMLLMTLRFKEAALIVEAMYGSEKKELRIPFPSDTVIDEISELRITVSYKNNSSLDKQKGSPLGVEIPPSEEGETVLLQCQWYDASSYLLFTKPDKATQEMAGQVVLGSGKGPSSEEGSEPIPSFPVVIVDEFGLSYEK
ncbi:hypothetical protein [Treponema sp. J25]|uniref:hypothetical protein n=1 Tax=Treponema sp. J25 TaxID=2094121 RepID=UPI001042B167|nr:hypothetical protein [Treponema sp. J25]HOM24201.1 hypothetical protein [Termitinemataceae bacterium]HPQ01234.1 hypothetical protein [Termitinemataceae bacterium]